MKKLLLAALLALVPAIASAQTPPAVGVPATPFSGNGSVTVNGLNGQTTCLVYAQALSGATIFFEASTDGSFAQSSPGVPVSTAAGVVIPAGSAASAAGYYFAPAPLGSFRARLVYSSGTPVMSLNCYAGASTPLTGTVSATIVGPGASAATPAYVQQTNSGVSIDPRVISFVSAQPVTGTFFQATQPVSCASGATCPVNATLQGTSPVSLATLPALVAGTAVIGSTGTTSVPNVGQLVDGTTPTQKAAVSAGGALKVDNSAVTQPVAFANNPCINTIPTEVAISTASATTVQLVAISGSTRIYVCQMDFMAGGTTNVTLEYGTGSSCGTGTTALTGAYPLVANTGLVKGSGAGVVGITPAAQALCIVNSAAVQLSGSLMFVQV